MQPEETNKILQSAFCSLHGNFWQTENSKFACVSLIYLTETLVMCVFQANRCCLFREQGKGNPCSGITTSKVSTVSPDGNSRPQNTGMNATFSLVVTSFIKKDTLVKAEVGEHVTRDALSVCKNTHFPLMECKVKTKLQIKYNRSIAYKWSGDMSEVWNLGQYISTIIKQG